MISKQHLKFIKSLQIKKFREQARSFLVEGEKSVVELIRSEFKINIIFATKRFLDQHIELIRRKNISYFEADERTLSKAGTLQYNQSVIAVAGMAEFPDLIPADHQVIPVFEFLQDPGNLGSILRICDWYGINAIVLSAGSVDVYNPKVIQASMGSFLRVRVYYEDISLLMVKADMFKVGTSPEGQPLYQFQWPGKMMILFGNESKGLSADIMEALDQVVTIPGSGQAESLNVAMSTAIVLDNINRAGILKK